LGAAALIVFLAGALAVGVGTLAGVAGPGSAERPPAEDRREQVAAAAPLRPLFPAPAPGKQGQPQEKEGAVPVKGRVLTADGKPLAGASVAVLGFVKDHGRGGDLVTERSRTLARGQTDADGRVQLTAAEASSEEFGE